MAHRDPAVRIPVATTGAALAEESMVTVNIVNIRA
jgi:hypothetical protein